MLPVKKLIFLFVTTAAVQALNFVYTINNFRKKCAFPVLIVVAVVGVGAVVIVVAVVSVIVVDVVAVVIVVVIAAADVIVVAAVIVVGVVKEVNKSM